MRFTVLIVTLFFTMLLSLSMGGVSASGAAIQGLFRNPLADPALIGVSAAAAFSEAT